MFFFHYKRYGNLLVCLFINPILFYFFRDCFVARITEDDMRYYMQCVVEANINILRVWGGARYETRLFYELCDANGVMLWQVCHGLVFLVNQYTSNLSNYSASSTLELL